MKPTHTLTLDRKSIDFERNNNFFKNYDHIKVKKQIVTEYEEKLAKIKEQKDKMWNQRNRFYYDHLVLKEAELKSKDPSIRIIPMY